MILKTLCDAGNPRAVQGDEGESVVPRHSVASRTRTAASARRKR
jgi:hypothetical protein